MHKKQRWRYTKRKKVKTVQNIQIKRIHIHGKAESRVTKRHIKNMLFAIEDSLFMESV